METPEKLYFGENDKSVLDIYSTKESDNEVEYVRKDAFIEKARSYIRLYLALLDTENNDCMLEWLDKFRNAMEK